MTRYTTSQTVTAPSAGTYEIGCWGGGAGGGNAQNGPGGGGGAFSYASVAVNAGDQLVLTIPNAAATGSNGGTVTVVRNSITLCSALGGTGSAGGTTGGVGSTKFAGGNGGAGDSYFDGEFGTWYYNVGGGGGAAGRGGAGGTGGNADSDFGADQNGSAGAGNNSYTGTNWDGGNGNGGIPGGGGAGQGSGGKGAVELVFTASAAAPVITPSTTAFNVNENVAFAQDFNADQGVTWSLVGGTDQAKFSINSSGNLTMPAKNYDAPDDNNLDNVYQVTFRATNTDGSGLFTNKTVTVTVLNDTAAPTITPATAAFTVNSGAVFSQDFNSNQVGTTWSKVGGADAALFSIDANGLLTLPAQDFGAPADSGANNVYDVTIRATGPEGVTTDKAITVTVVSPEYFPTASSQDAVGDRGWTNLANLYSDNEVTTTFGIGPGSGEVSYTATLSGFDLSNIPDTATINGVELITEINPTLGSGTIAGTVDFTLKSGASSVKSTASFTRLTAEFVATLGGPTDMWGLSGANLTGVGFKSSFNVTMRVVAAATGTGRLNPQIDYVKLKIYYTLPAELIAENVNAGTPEIVEANVGQKHVLGAVGFDDFTSPPAISLSAIGQRHALTSTNIASAAPAILAATIGQRHALSNINIATTAPSITAPTIGQRHVLASIAVTTTAPAITQPVLVLAKQFTAVNIVTSAPAIALATLNRIVAAITVNISTAAPAITTAAVGQRHVLATTNLSGIAPAISLSTIGQRHTLATVALATNIPTIQAATVGQRHALIATNLATPTAVVQQATLGVIPAEIRSARAVETIIQGQWTTETGGSDLHNSIDEIGPSDADYIKSEPDVINNVTRIKLGGWQANTVHGTMKLRYRLQRVGPNTAFTQTVRLYEGSTLIAGPFVHNVDTMQAFEQDVDSALVTNPNNLFVEFEAA